MAKVVINFLKVNLFGKDLEAYWRQLEGPEGRLKRIKPWMNVIWYAMVWRLLTSVWSINPKLPSGCAMIFLLPRMMSFSCKSLQMRRPRRCVLPLPRTTSFYTFQRGFRDWLHSKMKNLEMDACSEIKFCKLRAYENKSVNFQHDYFPVLGFSFGQIPDSSDRRTRWLHFVCDQGLWRTIAFHHFLHEYKHRALNAACRNKVTLNLAIEISSTSKECCPQLISRKHNQDAATSSSYTASGGSFFSNFQKRKSVQIDSIKFEGSRTSRRRQVRAVFLPNFRTNARIWRRAPRQGNFSVLFLK